MIRSALICVGVVLGVLLPALRAGGAITGHGSAPANPQTPGYHMLIYAFEGEDGKPRTAPFVLYLPEEYGKKEGPWPLLVALHGLGERGHDHQQIMAAAVRRSLTDSGLQQWAPFAVLFPQCPAEVRWETPSCAKMVAAMTRQVARQWPIDDKRIYLHGASMGGSGCWSVALADPSLFAVVAPVVGNEVEPEAVAAALKGKGVTCLVISGTHDPKSEPGSTHMVEAIRKAGVDTVQVKVPFGGHNLYQAFYGSKVFYEWLLSHRLGQEPPRDRLPAEKLLAMTASLTKTTEARYNELNEQLQTVAKWWQVDGCDLRRQPGLRAQAMGRSNIFTTNPFTDKTKAYGLRYWPCRFQTTQRLPAAKRVLLRISVAHFPTGSFTLEVRVNERPHFTKVVDSDSSQKGWATIDADLSEYAGQEVRLQIVQSNNGNPRDDAYWESVTIVTP